MNKCDTCKFAEWEISEWDGMAVFTDCNLGFRKKFESDEDCKRYKPYEVGDKE